MKNAAKLLLHACFLLLSISLVGCTRAWGSPPDGDRPALKFSQVKEKVVVNDFSRYFGGLTGGFVLFDTEQNQYVVYDEGQSEKRASPCSTFKFLNSLIGLETGVLEDENAVIKWDGRRNDIESWNQDQTLASAFSRSVVWYYQEVASRIGREQMQDFLVKADYGNRDMSGGLTKFWLVSSLRTSALEQVVFLRKLLSSELPFSQRNIDIVKKLALISDDDGSVLYGKTGFAGSGIGWFVGWVQKDGRSYIFATRVEGKNVKTSSATSIAQSILKDVVR